LFLSSSEESEDEDCFVCLLANAGDGGTTAFFAVVTATGAKKIEYWFRMEIDNLISNKIR